MGSEEVDAARNNLQKMADSSESRRHPWGWVEGGMVAVFLGLEWERFCKKGGKERRQEAIGNGEMPRAIFAPYFLRAFFTLERLKVTNVPMKGWGICYLMSPLAASMRGGDPRGLKL